MADTLRKTMVRMFKQKASPTQFLSSLAEVQTTLAVEIEIDIKRGRELFAVDITPGAGSRSNKSTRYTTKKYVPPTYNESDAITAEELQTRLPGMHAYDAGSQPYQAALAALVTDRQADLQDKIIRSIELQARDAIFSGTITLQNGDTIDFKKKATHAITPAVKWDQDTATILEDLAAGCALCRKDGKINASTFSLIVADDVIEVIKKNPDFVERADLRRVDNVDLMMPSDINTEGSVFHGQFAAGSYKINLWTYPQFYEVPEGFGLANEGTLQPYIPSAGAALLPPNLDMRLWYAGVPTVVNQVDSQLAGMGLTDGTLSIVETDFHPYAFLDNRMESVEFGVKSKPLFVPVAIDGFVTYETVLT
jgi:hypothetical protein